MYLKKNTAFREIPLESILSDSERLPGSTVFLSYKVVFSSFL